MPSFNEILVHAITCNCCMSDANIRLSINLLGNSRLTDRDMLTAQNDLSYLISAIHSEE